VGLSSVYGVAGLKNYERKMITKVARFTASGTWTVPTGVTYAIAHIRGAGGGVGRTGGGNGGSSSVAFASGTITANGGTNAGYANYGTLGANTGAANSGQGAFLTNDVTAARGGDGAFIVAGADVAAGASITITIGAGGTAGTSGAAGGSGYIWIEYQVPA
jgi:hypothetical protein